MPSISELVRQVQAIKGRSDELSQMAGSAGQSLATSARAISAIVQGSQSGMDAARAVDAASRSCGDAASAMKALARACDECVAGLTR